MRKYKIKIPRVVFEDLEECALYIAEDSVKAAFEWYELMQQKINSLETSPMRCPIAEESKYFGYEIRHLIVGNYRILFSIYQDAGVVRILHIYHGARERKPF